ncbi:MAG: hypothetical protein ACRCT8_11265 [Lacipirellulaceae bacterium]
MLDVPPLDLGLPSCVLAVVALLVWLVGAWGVMVPGGWIVAAGLAPFTQRFSAPKAAQPAELEDGAGPQGTSVVDIVAGTENGPASSLAERGFPGGGAMIGRLERLLIYLFVMAGEPGAIGFLIAAKSVFRFGELSDKANRLEAEYITIGTLMSFAVGLTLSLGVQWGMRTAMSPH